MNVLIVALAPWSKRLKERLDSSCAVTIVRDDDAAAIERALPSADILISGRFDAAMARRATSLKLIICPWAGTENIDRAHVPAGVDVVSSGGPEEAIAEYVLATLVAMRRNLFDADRRLRAGEWKYGFLADRFVDEVNGSALGMIGFGRIGHEVAKRAAPFGIRCRALTMHPKHAQPPPGIAMDVGALTDTAAIDSLVEWSDAIVVCCELSDATRAMFDARRLARMKPTAILINVARAGVVVEQALFDALRAERIGGAVLDVWYRYPSRRGEQQVPSTCDFAALENVIMTPHYSGWTRPGVERRLDGIVDAVESFASKNRG
jgi:phosphoglycerate dehydrogenase-like enzyme